MPKSGIVIAALFLAMALFQGVQAMRGPDEPAPPASTVTTPEPTPTPTAFPPPSGPIPEPKKYGSTEQLVAHLSEAGIGCTLEYLDQPDRTLQEFSLCDPGSTDRRLNIYLYPSRPNRRLWINGMREQQLPLPLVWGPNWIVVAAGEPSTAKSRIKSIQGVIGGTIEDFAPKK